MQRMPDSFCQPFLVFHVFSHNSNRGERISHERSLYRALRQFGANSDFMRSIAISASLSDTIKENSLFLSGTIVTINNLIPCLATALNVRVWTSAMSLPGVARSEKNSSVSERRNPFHREVGFKTSVGYKSARRSWVESVEDFNGDVL